MIRCPLCGVQVRQDRLSKHRRKVHPGEELARLPQQDNQNMLSGMADKALEKWMADIKKELKGLTVGFSEERIQQLNREKRMITAELKKRKALPRQTMWKRWSKGPGSVRQVSGRSIWAHKTIAEQRKEEGQ